MEMAWAKSSSFHASPSVVSCLDFDAERWRRPPTWYLAAMAKTLTCPRRKFFGLAGRVAVVSTDQTPFVFPFPVFSAWTPSRIFFV